MDTDRILATQGKIPASTYFDIKKCSSYEDFCKIKNELEGEGFIPWEGSSVSTSSVQYQLFLKEEEKRQKLKRPRETSEEGQLAKARIENNFRNRVDEHIWQIRNQGYNMILTQGFDPDYGTMDDDLVAFFCRKE